MKYRKVALILLDRELFGMLLVDKTDKVGIADNLDMLTEQTGVDSVANCTENQEEKIQDNIEDSVHMDSMHMNSLLKLMLHFHSQHY